MLENVGGDDRVERRRVERRCHEVFTTQSVANLAGRDIGPERGLLVALEVAKVASKWTDLAGLPDPRSGELGFGGELGGRITTAGVVTNFKAPGIDAPFVITPGPDGALWFTNLDNPSIGRITTAGVITLFGQTDASTVGITAGSDGALWFASLAEPTGSIGRIALGAPPTIMPGNPTNATMGRIINLGFGVIVNDD